MYNVQVTNLYKGNTIHSCYSIACRGIISSLCTGAKFHRIKVTSSRLTDHKSEPNLINIILNMAVDILSLIIKLHITHKHTFQIDYSFENTQILCEAFLLGAELSSEISLNEMSIEYRN